MGGGRGLPGFDYDDDGTGGPQGLIAAAEYIMAMPDGVKVIPAHGALASKADVAKGLDLLKPLTAAVQAGIDQGKTLEQLKQEKVLAKWDDRGSTTGRGMTTDHYLELLYRSLSQKK